MRDFYDDSDQLVQRRRGRLSDDLALDEETVEMVLRLRTQLAAMQKLVLTLQSELARYHSDRTTRLSGYRRTSIDVVWREVSEADKR